MTNWIGKEVVVDLRQTAAIIDIDGVLCHVGWYTNPRDFNWKEFAEKDHSRENLIEGINLVHMMISVGIIPVFLTARHEEMREQTEDFLNSSGFSCYELVMTSVGTFDEEVHEKYQEYQASCKRKALEDLVNRYNFLYAVDDQEPNCQVYRQFGIPTLKAMFTNEEFIRAGDHE